MPYNKSARTDANHIINLALQNIGLSEIYTSISPQDIMDRFVSSALWEFSKLSPHIEKIMLTDRERLHQKAAENAKSTIYRIPDWVNDFGQLEILGVTYVDVISPAGFSDLYVPQSSWINPESVISAISDVKIAAGVAASLGRAPTCEFEPPNKVRLYNGWSAGRYMCEVLLSHDPSLTTVSPTVMPSLLRLTELDLGEYIYNRIKRLDNISTPVGQINLRIDDLAQYGDRKRDLIREFAESSELDFLHITYF
jgi:hypothetical protein